MNPERIDVFEEFYWGWRNAAVGRPCKPPPLISEGMKTIFIDGHRMSLSHAAKSKKVSLVP
jgi:hypothetical protein